MYTYIRMTFGQNIGMTFQAVEEQSNIRLKFSEKICKYCPMNCSV